MPRPDENRGRFRRRPGWEDQNQDWQDRPSSSWDANPNRWSSRSRDSFGGYDRGEDPHWDYQGMYYNRGNFNPRWNFEEGYGRSSNYDRSTGRLYDPRDRGWSGRDADLEDFGQRSGYFQGSEWSWQDDRDLEDEDNPEFWFSETWWVVPGPYTGVGPRNYQRSDERIQEDVNIRLYQHGRIDASDIDVEVKDGEVWLRGSVDSRRSKRLAEDIIEEVFGVNDIHNELRVHQENRYNQRSWGRQSQATGIHQAVENREETPAQTEGQMENRDQSRILPGMEVVGSDGGTIGQIKEIRESDFLVNRPMARDVYIPYSACQSRSGKVVLNIRSDQVNEQNWPAPEVFGLGGEGQEGMDG